MATPFANNSPTIKLYHGDAKCPRTVVIQILQQPSADANLFVGPDKAELDQASPGAAVGTLTAGVGVIDLSFNDRLILHGVKTDIYGRATPFSSATPLLVGVEAF